MTGPYFLAELARADVPLYIIAAEVGLNPSRLGAMLRGRIPLRGEVACRLQAALKRRMSAQRS